MKLPRREFLTSAASVAMLPAVTSAARTETYPSRPVHWIVSFLAGGANDIVARIIGLIDETDKWSKVIGAAGIKAE